MADRRRVAVWLMIAGVGILIAAATMGDLLLFGVLAAVLGGAGVFHWRYACRRCGNPHCALNARGECFVLGRDTPVGAAACAGQDAAVLDAKVAGLPVAAAVLFGLVLAWMAVPEAAVSAVAFIAVGGVLYSGATCASCVNDCPLNRNPNLPGDGSRSENGRGGAHTGT